MIKFVTYLFYYVFLMIGGRFFFTLFFYKTYTPPSFGYVSSSKRQIAFQLDIAVLMVVLFILFIITNTVFSISSPDINFLSVFNYMKTNANSSTTTLILFILLLIVYCFYSAICELTIGASVGKKILEIQSVTTKFKTPNSSQIILRNGVKLFSLFFSPILFFIIYKDKKRRWPHDKASLTVVIDTQKIQDIS